MIFEYPVSFLDTFFVVDGAEKSGDRLDDLDGGGDDDVDGGGGGGDDDDDDEGGGSLIVEYLIVKGFTSGNNTEKATKINKNSINNSIFFSSFF